jgi:hypothetical protein
MKIVKTKVQAKTRALAAGWTMEEQQVIEHEIGSEFAKVLQEQIDKEFIMSIKAENLVEQGWVRVPFTVMTSIDWFVENIRDEYVMILGEMYFKSSEDAVLYSLAWSEQDREYD